MAGLLKPRSGSILLHDQNIVGVPADKIVSKGMALCPEGRRIFLQMTVLENLEMGGYTRPNSELEESIENVYDHFPRLKERYKQVAGTLSGGEQQMLVEQIFDIIRELKQAGTTILLVEQNAQMALSIADRAYVLETGKIVNEGSASDLLHDDSVRRAYLGN